ncbi:molybdopterin molybdotransferase MoeA [Corynebacterium striatum]
MRSPQEHFEAIMSHARPVPVEVFPEAQPVNEKLLGRVIAEYVTARLAVPPFSNSAMDGFLVHVKNLVELPARLPVAGDVPAGQAPKEVPAGKAVRIMTGAPVPEDNDGLVVVPVELTDIPAGPHELPSEVTINETPRRTHIRPKGENVREGVTIAKPGTVVDAGLIAALISAGITHVRVYRPVLVGVVSSGDELVEGSSLEPGQLPDSNGPMIESLIRSTIPHAVVTHMRSSDSPVQLRETIEQLFHSHEVVITAGGVSAGAFDVTQTVLQAAEDCEAWFGGVKQKPGTPQGFSLYGGLPVISLPGNPVAAFVSYHLYVSPFLEALSGRPARTKVCSGRTIVARAGEEFPVAHKHGTAFVPTRLEFGEFVVAYPFASGLSSHFVASLHGTCGLVEVTSEIQAGDEVRVVIY